MLRSSSTPCHSLRCSNYLSLRSVRRLCTYRAWERVTPPRWRSNTVKIGNLGCLTSGDDHLLKPRLARGGISISSIARSKYVSTGVSISLGTRLGKWGGWTTKFASLASVEAAGAGAGYSRQKATIIWFAPYSACHGSVGAERSSGAGVPARARPRAHGRYPHIDHDQTDQVCPLPRNRPCLLLLLGRAIHMRRDIGVRFYRLSAGAARTRRSGRPRGSAGNHTTMGHLPASRPN